MGEVECTDAEGERRPRDRIPRDHISWPDVATVRCSTPTSPRLGRPRVEPGDHPRIKAGPGVGGQPSAPGAAAVFTRRVFPGVLRCWVGGRVTHRRMTHETASDAATTSAAEISKRGILRRRLESVA